MVVQALLLLALAAPPADEVVVRREGVRVLQAPRSFAPACAVTPPRPQQKLKLLERKGPWARVASPGGGKCWIQETAWEDRVAGELTAAGVEASEDDVELAARGFSEDMVKQYQADHPDLERAFAVLAAYLRGAAEPRDAELRSFVVEGRLQGAEPVGTAAAPVKAPRNRARAREAAAPVAAEGAP